MTKNYREYQEYLNVTPGNQYASVNRMALKQRGTEISRKISKKSTESKSQGQHHVNGADILPVFCAHELLPGWLSPATSSQQAQPGFPSLASSSLSPNPGQPPCTVTTGQEKTWKQNNVSAEIYNICILELLHLRGTFASGVFSQKPDLCTDELYQHVTVPATQCGSSIEALSRYSGSSGQHQRLWLRS